MHPAAMRDPRARSPVESRRKRAQRCSKATATNPISPLAQSSQPVIRCLDAQSVGLHFLFFAMTRTEFLRLMVGATSAWAASEILCANPAMSDRMHTRPIPSNRAPLPLVGCGTWRTFDVGQGLAERTQLLEVLRILFDNGGSVIDSSPMYGAAETVVGELLTTMKAHDKAFIATKVWTRGREAGIAQMRRSMELLRVDRIDLMQVHNLVDWRTQLATLRVWKKEGLIRYIGVTHYTPSAFDELESVMRAERPDFVQLDYSLSDRAAEQRLLPLAADVGVAVIVNQPFGGGGLLQSMRAKPLPPWASEIGCETWAQILLKFVLANPAVTCVIPGTGRPEHMKDNVRAGFGHYPDAALRAKMVATLLG
jgi:diketogulonate reductase-like aldo/keto reductase